MQSPPRPGNRNPSVAPKDVVNRIESLAPLHVTSRYLSVLLKSQQSASQIAEVLACDPAMMANLLRLNTSDQFPAGIRLEHLEATIVRLGVDRLLRQIVGDPFLQPDPPPLYALEEKNLWLHAAATSVAATELIRQCHPSCPENLARAAALLHDIGKLLMLRYCSIDTKAILEECESHRLSFLEAERRLAGFTHVQLGVELARCWNFPPAIVEAIKAHHEFPATPASSVLDVVMLANLATKTIGFGWSGEATNLRADPECRRRLGLDFDGFCMVCARTTTRLIRLGKTLGVATTPVPL